MAVQKSRKTRSTRGMRRSHNSLTESTISTDQETGELHLRHHLTSNGYYKGRQVIVKKVKSQLDNNQENNEG